MIWTAGFRTAVISPYEQIQLTEPRGFADQTVRQVLHMAGGGERLRVRLTNRYGRTPLTIAAAATAATEHGQAALTFDGAEKLTIPPGEEAAGDPMDLPVAPGADLACWRERLGETSEMCFQVFDGTGMRGGRIALVDALDRQILAELQQDGRLTVTELPERIGLSLSPCHRRLRALERSGAISGYHADLNANALGL